MKAVLLPADKGRGGNQDESVACLSGFGCYAGDSAVSAGSWQWAVCGSTASSSIIAVSVETNQAASAASQVLHDNGHPLKEALEEMEVENSSNQFDAIMSILDMMRNILE